MVINLCLPSYRPKIQCNKISADGYEVENLISEDPVKRNRGFRCEYFVTPPVQITIEFPFFIEISKINIETTSSGGSPPLTALSIYTTSTSSDKDLLTLVGNVQLKNQCRAVFHNRGFKARTSFRKEQPASLFPLAASYELWSKGPVSLGCVRRLKISINRVVGGVPGIKRIEVWGQPGHSCGPEVIARVVEIMNESISPASGPLIPPTVMESNCVPHNLSDIAQPNPQELDFHGVPEEFLDPITLEVMTLPILLPSGKVIDQSTLEKCNRSEASWGRQPSDPFTGITFSQHAQPLPHPSLKARIDHYLLQHNIPGSNILGRSRAAAMIAPSSITVSSLKRKMDCLEQSVNSSNHLAPSSFATNCLVLPTSETCAKKMKTDLEIGTSQMDCSAVPDCHEQRLSQSLDMALASALGSMPSFTAKVHKVPQQLASVRDLCSSTSWNSNTVPDHNGGNVAQGCSSCSRTFTAYHNTEPIYQLPCGHLLCRPCLAEKQKSFTILCMNCKRSVAAKDVQRVHL